MTQKTVEVISNTSVKVNIANRSAKVSWRADSIAGRVKTALVKAGVAKKVNWYGLQAYNDQGSFVLKTKLLRYRLALKYSLLESFTAKERAAFVKDVTAQFKRAKFKNVYVEIYDVKKQMWGRLGDIYVHYSRAVCEC